MRPKFLLLCFALLVISSSSFAKIWRVNNSAGVNANFTQLQAAIQSTLVGNGDTIYVEASSATYDNVSDINKSVVIIGPGYFLSNWTSPVQYNLSSAKFDGIQGTSANNVRIMGLTLNYIYITGNGLSLSRNNIGYVYLWAHLTNNTNITQNWIGLIQNYHGYASTNLRIANNIVVQGIAMGGSDNGLMEYNVFCIGGGYYINFNGGAFNFEKNILASSGAAVTNSTNVLFKYNMSGANSFPTTNGNQNNINMANNAVFINNTYSDYNDQYYMLSGSSPAKTAGPGNTPIGAYAGAAPYVASGIPPIPTIYDITIPQSTQTGSSVQIKFSSKSNN